MNLVIDIRAMQREAFGKSLMKQPVIRQHIGRMISSVFYSLNIYYTHTHSLNDLVNVLLSLKRFAHRRAHTHTHTHTLTHTQHTHTHTLTHSGNTRQLTPPT
jgi:hypothetical protein